MSKNLYIIRNGFDIHHGIPSRYSDFKHYIKNTDSRLHDRIEEHLPIDEKWSELEAAFANLDVDHITDKAEQFLMSYSADDWSDSGPHDYQYELNNIIEDLSYGVKSHFCEWIRGLEIKPIWQLSCKRLPIDPQAIFLTFNYTQTLQITYQIAGENIVHIHGKSVDEDSDIVLGHSWDPDDIPDFNDVPDPEDRDIRIHEGYELINNYFRNTFKPSATIIKNNQSFFSRLKNVDRVWVLGHSLSYVDMEYFEVLVRSLQENTDWIITFRGDDELQRHRQTASRLGIKHVRFCAIHELA